MAEIREDEPATKLNPIAQFFADIGKGLRGGVVAWITAGILGLVTAGGTIYYNKFRDEVKEARISETNISAKDAFEEAKRNVGSNILLAVPFKNRDDPTQYIAVWYQDDADEPECENFPCLDQLGATKVALLVGNDGLYERRPTDLHAGPDFNYDYDQDPRALGLAFSEYGGVTDWNDDGVRELFTIEVTSGTAPTQYTVLTVADSKSLRRQQLRMASSRTGETPTFIGDPDAKLRAWLGQRYNEHVAGRAFEQCQPRKLNGERTCSGPAFRDAEETDADRLFAQALDDWIVTHGRDFVVGKLTLRFKPGLLADPEATCFEVGGYQWVNLFKGPLIVNDRKGNRTAVAYAQDGDHHREIPFVFRGQTFVWLGLAARNELLVIDPRQWRVERVHVAEWEQGIPDPYEQGKMLERTATKEQQVSLAMVDGRLLYAGKPLSLSYRGKEIDQAAEFASAQGCQL